METDEIQAPKLPLKCTLCHHERNLEIQDDIDGGLGNVKISEKYDLPIHVITNHISKSHREKLIAWGIVDNKVREEAINIAEILTEYIRVWSQGIRRRLPKNIDDKDALKAISELNKLHGSIVNKHEVVVKQDIGKAIKDYLDSIEEDIEKEKDEGD